MRTAEEWGRVAVSLPGWRSPDLPPDCDVPALWDAGSAQPVPDPNHWAWTGWLLALLGPGGSINATGGRVTAWLRVDGARVEGSGTDIGRACIAAAEALGRWPGGEG